MAHTGYGITITGASGFVASITDTTPPEWARESIGTSHTTTTDGAMTFIPSDLIDYGQLEVEMHFDEDVTPPIDDDPESWVLTFPSGTTWTFNGFLTSYAPSAPIDDVCVATVTIKVSGKIEIGVA